MPRPALISGPRGDAAGRRDDAEFGGEGSLVRKSFEKADPEIMLAPTAAATPNAAATYTIS